MSLRKVIHWVKKSVFSWGLCLRRVGWLVCRLGVGWGFVLVGPVLDVAWCCLGLSCIGWLLGLVVGGGEGVF